jgi:hypothetical protein
VRDDVGGDPGGAVHVDPLKPKLRPPGTKSLKPEYDGLLSNFGFKFNLRRYIPAGLGRRQPLAVLSGPTFAAGAYTRSLQSST